MTASSVPRPPMAPLRPTTWCWRPALLRLTWPRPWLSACRSSRPPACSCIRARMAQTGCSTGWCSRTGCTCARPPRAASSPGEFGGDDPGADPADTARALFAEMQAMLVGGDRLELDFHTIGYRPMPADGFPIIGRADRHRRPLRRRHAFRHHARAGGRAVRRAGNPRGPPRSAASAIRPVALRSVAAAVSSRAAGEIRRSMASSPQRPPAAATPTSACRPAARRSACLGDRSRTAARARDGRCS